MLAGIDVPKTPGRGLQSAVYGFCHVGSVTNVMLREVQLSGDGADVLGRLAVPLQRCGARVRQSQIAHCGIAPATETSGRRPLAGVALWRSGRNKEQT
jgi:hypothetical protein